MTEWQIVVAVGAMGTLLASVWMVLLLVQISGRLDEISRSLRNNHEDLGVRLDDVSRAIENSTTTLGMDLERLLSRGERDEPPPR